MTIIIASDGTTYFIDYIKMNIFLLIAIGVCSYTHGATLENEILPPGVSVNKNLQNTHLELKLSSINHAEISNDQLDQLQNQEETYGRSMIADTIQNLLEGFRDTVINGNDDIPPLDPLVLPEMGPYEFAVTGAKAEATIKDFRMEGLMWYVVDYVTFDALRLTIGTHITIPRLTVTGSYDAKARLALILTHTATGNIRVFINRIEFGLNMRLGTNIFAGHLLLRELDIKIDIHDTNIQITGMTGSTLINSAINSIVQGVTQEVIQTQMENVSKILSEELFDIINDILKDYTINDILG